jgi:riboflavin synthase
MFTGIIETIGTIEEVKSTGTNKTFWISSSLSPEFKVDQSISHNGVCLTVEEVQGNRHRVTAIAETLQKSNLGHWETGGLVNIERCMLMNGRLDGHIVQGHVDARGTCTSVETKEGSWEYSFSFPSSFASLIIEKGSICVNGISLTVVNSKDDTFSVAIIPYTYEHTNLQNVKPGDTVNLEFDIIGKYVAKLMGK